MKPMQTLVGTLAVAGLIVAAPFVAQATPPLGIFFTPVGRATVPAFDVRRTFLLQTGDDADDRNDDGDREHKSWKLQLEATAPIDVATQVVTFPVGANSGWHTHPGPVFFTVRTGTLTVYEGDDPTCTPHVFTAGTGAVEAATSRHIHMVRNQTRDVAEAVVTYMVPAGTPQKQLRTDLPNPGNCPF
jgi:hypothetical protein